MRTLSLDGLEKVEVYGAVTAKKTPSEKQKKNRDGVPGWVVRVLVSRDAGRVTEPVNVTVWCPAEPDVADGDIVSFSGLTVGCFLNGNRPDLYIHADGVVKEDSNQPVLNF